MKLPIAGGFVMVYTENSSAQAGACNANLGLTVAPVVTGARADDNPTRILQRRNSHLERAPFCVSGETVTVTSITQLLSQLLAATGKPRQAKRAALKRLLGRERLTPPAVRVYGRGGKAVTW